MIHSDEIVDLTTSEEMTLAELADRIASSVPHEFAPTFIALLDAAYQTWEVTGDVVKHFLALKLEYEIDYPDNDKFEPEKLL